MCSFLVCCEAGQSKPNFSDGNVRWYVEAASGSKVSEKSTIRRISLHGALASAELANLLAIDLARFVAPHPFLAHERPYLFDRRPAAFSHHARVLSRSRR